MTAACLSRILKGICHDASDGATVAVICPYKAQRMLLQSIIADMPSLSKVSHVITDGQPQSKAISVLALHHAVLVIAEVVPDARSSLLTESVFKFSCCS